MIYARKEHATIFLNGFVFAIGGYDGNSKEMLSTCEKYDFAQDKWTLVDSLNQQKCAFAATGVENKLIFVFGGYNGRERLNTIERYSYD
jgi:N-acetylneuraminic acid mutarotase